MKKEYSTVLVISLSAVLLYFLSHKTVFLYFALSLAIVCLLSPWVAAKTHFLWMKLSQALGSVSAVIILTVIFCLVIVPLSIIARMTGKKFITQEKNQVTYFKERNFIYTRESMENVW